MRCIDWLLVLWCSWLIYPCFLFYGQRKVVISVICIMLKFDFISDQGVLCFWLGQISGGPNLTNKFMIYLRLFGLSLVLVPSPRLDQQVLLDPDPNPINLDLDQLCHYNCNKNMQISRNIKYPSIRGKKQYRNCFYYYYYQSDFWV